MQFNRYVFSVILALMAFAAPAFSQCQTSAPIDLLQQNGNTISVGTTIQAPSGNSIYVWNFGDGSSSYGQFPTHFYPNNGVYIVELTIYDSLQTSWCAYGIYTIQVNSGVNCNINTTYLTTALPNGLVILDSVEVSNAVLPITYEWVFSNGFISTAPMVEQTFPTGYYSVCLTVTDANGCTDTTCNSFNITNGPCANNFITAQPQINQQDLALVVFSNTSALPVLLHIDYGDGAIQDAILTSAFTATHHYNNVNQTYLLCLTATDANGCTDTLCQPVVTTSCLSLPVSFQSYGFGGNVFEFYPSVSGGQAPYTYTWNYGDGTVVTADTGGSIYNYPFPGTYTACLTVTDVNGCSGQYCQQITINPCVNFFPQIISTTNGLTATFTPLINGGCGIYTYLWQTQNQTGAGPSFTATYTQPGSYSVILTVSDNCGCNQVVTGVVYVGCTQTGGPQLLMHTGNQTTCNAQFFDSGNLSAAYLNNENYTLTLYPSTPGSKLRVTFNSYDLETNYDYLAIHNGQSTSSQILANLNGAITGPISYTSTANDGSLTFHFTSDFTVVSNGWNAQISCTDLSIAAVNQNNGSWQISSTSAQSWTSYSWSLDGAPLSNTTASFNYPMPEGNHQLCLTAVNSLGCSEQTCLYVDVPCTYQIDLTTQITGNTVSVIVNNLDPQLYYSLSSDQSWQQIVNGQAEITYLTAGVHQICVYADGVCMDSACVNIDLGTLNSDNVSGYVWDDANGNGLFEPNENPFINSYVQLCLNTGSIQDSTSCIWTTTDSSGHYSFDVFAGNYSITSYIWQNLYVPTLPSIGGGYTFSTTGTADQTGFDFGYQNQAVVISGNVFYDANNNGVQDTGETGAPYKAIQIGNYWTYTDYNGHYMLNIIPGTYMISLMYPGNGYSYSVPASPYTYNVIANTIGQTYSGYNFGLWADPNLQDLSASITHISTVTPGFPVMTYLSYCNNGVTAQSGTFNYYWDPQLAISSAGVFSPAPTTFNAAGNTASWTFTNLAPGQCTYIYQNTPAPTSLVLGTPVNNTVVVTPLNDSYPSNNIDTLHQVVVGSWDPNDKQGVPAGIGEEGSILPNTRLSYTIRFQNTGMAPAVNVVLVDTLSDDFLIETFSMVAASDNYSVQIDQATRVIRWTFNNIMLPDSTSDPIGSIGFVSFSIDPVQNQLDGTVLNNFADIYFDFNVPVRTNTTVHTIDRSAGLENVQNGTMVSVYPNPFNGSTQFFVNTPDNGNSRIQIYNVLGEIVAELNAESGKATVFDAHGYAAGMYYYKVTSKKSEASGKLIIR